MGSLTWTSDMNEQQTGSQTRQPTCQPPEKEAGIPAPKARMALTFDTIEATRRRELYGRDVLPRDVVLVFSTQPEAVRGAVRRHLLDQGHPPPTTPATACKSEGGTRVPLQPGVGPEAKEPYPANTATPAPAGRQYDGEQGPAVGSMRTEFPQLHGFKHWPDTIREEAHSWVLYMCSDLFKVEMTADAQHFEPLLLPKQLPDGRRVDQRVIVVGVDSQAELEAAQRLVKLMYQHDVVSDLWAQPQQLLDLCMLADRLQAHACAQACATALAGLPARDLPLTFISRLACVAESAVGKSIPQLKTMVWACAKNVAKHLASGQPPSDTLKKQITALVNLPADQLHNSVVMHVWGDADRVSNDSFLHKLFGDLPLAALNHWVGSDQLHTASENTVVALLHAWWLAQDGAVPVASMQPLAAHVRLRHLSPAYLIQVLLQLPWFGPRQHLPGLCYQYTAARSSLKANEVIFIPDDEGVPLAWLAPEARPRPASHAQGSVTLEVPLAQLQAGLTEVLAARAGDEEVHRIEGPPVAVNGFQLKARLQFRKRAGDAAAVVSPFVCYEGTAPCITLPIPWLSLEAEVGSQHGSTPGTYSHTKRFTSTFKAAQGTGYADFFGIGAITTIAPLTPFLVDGALRLRVHVTKVDGVVLGS